ncbi:MAG: DUF5723 family protein [Putridiphycobacter sp.]
MKKLILFALTIISVNSFAQTEYVAYTATGKGVASTFVTDYHTLGINPANLGWQQYPGKKVTTGSTEFGVSIYSSALSKQELRDNLWAVIKSQSLDTLTTDQKIQAAKDFGGSDFAFNFDNNLFGFSYQTPKFGGIAVSVRTRASWSSNFSSNFSELLFKGSQASYFDSLVYTNGTDTTLVPNDGSYDDSTGQVISGHASVPLNIGQLIDGSYLRLSWNREYHVGYGRQIINLDSNLIIYAGVGAKYIQGIAYFDLGAQDNNLQMVSAMSPGFDINYGLAALTNPSAIAGSAQNFFKNSVGQGWGFDVGANVLLFKKLHLAASVTNIGQMTYNANVYEAEDTLLVNFSNAGLQDMNITNSVPNLLEEGGLLKIKGRESYTVSLPGTFRMGASLDLGSFARIGLDMVAPFNDVPGSFNGFAWGLGGDVKLAGGKVFLSTGMTGGGGYDTQLPVGINFVFGEGAYEFGVSSRDAITFFKDNKPTISAAMGFARFRF